MPIKLIDGRSTRREEPDLGMRCDAREIPDPLAPGEPRGWWLAGLAVVRQGYTADPEEKLPAQQGLCALVITPAAVHAIVTPKAVSEPAIWLSAHLGSLRVQATGTQGLFKKRPEMVEIGAPEDGWSLTLAMVSRLYRSSNRAQSGQEASLVEALQA